ncbi:Synaptosomal-associated protein 25-B [Triplophysa tibetana]|uniref:Synaptosomal-associated protein 25-B n=1 Tax=Triplophysa tibetana TaxID=1572043 RepID=A0A5A9NQR5_9TELE|nr:Synaptosomal-associated protein 25-B [Triplophysa tibetana]
MVWSGWLVGENCRFWDVGRLDAQVREVMVHVDTSVPPRSEVLITGAVEGVVDGSQGMLEPSTSLNAHCDLLVARVVYKVEQGLLPVRVINVTEDTRILKRGMKVGTLFCDAEVEEGGGDCGNPMNTVDMLLDRLRLREKGFGESEMRALDAKWGSDQDWGLGNASVRAVREVTPSEERETDDELVTAQRKDTILQVVAQLRLKGEEGISNDAQEKEIEENLEQVGSIIGILKKMAIDMNKELDTQNKTIDSITDKVEKSTDRVEAATKKAKKIIKV